MFVLAIDTSNQILSIALVDNNQVLIEISELTKNNHSSRLMPVIEQAFSKIEKTPQELDLIAVAKGPGSYTGIRIGATVAKTLAWTLNIPLVGVSSLEVLAANLQTSHLIVPLFDARRQAVFAGAYQNGKNVFPDGHYPIAFLLDQLPTATIHFIGDVELYRDAIIRKLGGRAVFPTNDMNIPRASNLAKTAQNYPPITDIHQFVPEYHRLTEAEMNWIQAQNG